MSEGPQLDVPAAKLEAAKLKRPVENELADGRCLWTTLKNALGIMSGIASNPFSLKEPGPPVEIQGQLEMNRRVVQGRSRLNDVIQVDRVVETGKVRQAGDRVDSLVFPDLSF